MEKLIMDDGTEIFLTQDAYLECDCDSYLEPKPYYYTAIAVDVAENEYRVVWASITDTYTHHVNGGIAITGWRAGMEKVVVLYRIV